MSRRWASYDARMTQKSVLEIDKVCTVCGSDKKLGVHHIVPQSEGGADEEHNLVTVCDPCEKHVHKETFDIVNQGGIPVEYPSYRVHNIYLLRELMRGGKRAVSEAYREDYLSRRAIPKTEKDDNPDKLTKRVRNLAYILDRDMVDKSRLPWTMEVAGLSIEIKEAVNASERIVVAVPQPPILRRLPGKTSTTKK